MKLFIVLLSFCVVFAKHEKYNGYVVYEVYPNDANEIALLYDVVNELSLDVWSYAHLDTPGNIFVSEPLKKPFEDALSSARIAYKASVDNIRELLENEDKKLSAGIVMKNRNDTELTYDAIYTFEQVTDYLEAISQKYPNTTKLLSAGTSFEGRPILYLQISQTGFQDRFWRKNRRTGLSHGDLCVGVDLNRNFDIDWSTQSSFDVCSNTFHGLAPNSESETQAIANVISRYGNRMAMYADFHSHGSMIVYGWGNGTLVPNALILNLLAVRMAEAIDNVKWESKRNYRVGNIAILLNYRLSGGSTDYAQVAGIPFSYTYELPALLGGSGVNNFLVDPAFIFQAATETWESVKVAARYILGRP